MFLIDTCNNDKLCHLMLSWAVHCVLLCFFFPPPLTFFTSTCYYLWGLLLHLLCYYFSTCSWVLNFKDRVEWCSYESFALCIPTCIWALPPPSCPKCWNLLIWPSISAPFGRSLTDSCIEVMRKLKFLFESTGFYWKVALCELLCHICTYNFKSISTRGILSMRMSLSGSWVP